MDKWFHTTLCNGCNYLSMLELGSTHVSQRGPWHKIIPAIATRTPLRKITWRFETARFVFRIVRSLWNLTSTLAAMLPMCPSNFKAMRWFKLPISRLRDSMRSYDKTSYWILKRGPGWLALLGFIGINHHENDVSISCPTRQSTQINHATNKLQRL